MDRVQEMVTEFHETFGVPVGDHPHFLGNQREYMRFGLILEEVVELCEALEESNMVEIADAIGDSIYVLNGLAVEMGINLEPVLNEIHRSNMTKCSDTREDGKILKGENFEAPRLKEILVSQGWVEN